MTPPKQEEKQRGIYQSYRFSVASKDVKKE